MSNDNSILALSNKQWLTHSKPMLLYGMMLLGITLLPLVMALALGHFIFAPEASWMELLSKLWDKLASLDWSRELPDVLKLCAYWAVVTAFFVYWARAIKLERLMLSPDGIRYTSPLPPSLKWLYPDWVLPWGQVTKAEFGPVVKGRLLTQDGVLLTLASASGKRRIFPSRWVDADNYSRPASLPKLTFKHATPRLEEILDTIMASAVMRHLAKYAPHIVVSGNWEKTELFNSLERNFHGRISIIILILLMVYTAIDLIAGPDSYIDPPASLAYIYISAGVCGTILSAAWLSRSTLTKIEMGGLSMLIGVAVAFAMIPGALRINALTDRNNLPTYDYHVTLDADGVILQPAAPGLPSIDYFARNRYWGQFAKNHAYPVEIHKGLLGFYQFNSSAIADDIHHQEKN